MKNERIEGGAILLARKITESEIFVDKPDKWLKIWVYILSKVHWEDTKKYKRGQDFFRYDWIHLKTGASIDQIKHCIAWLKYATQIATQKKQRGFIITVINYNFYQNLDNYYYAKATQKGSQKEDTYKQELKEYDNRTKILARYLKTNPTSSMEKYTTDIYADFKLKEPTNAMIAWCNDKELEPNLKRWINWMRRAKKANELEAR